MTDRMNIQTSVQTTIDCFPVLMMYAWIIFNPTIVPQIAQNAIQMPSSKFISPFNAYMRLEAHVEKRTRYKLMPVTTSGGISSVSNDGVKIAPPPIPSAPAAKPPTKPNRISVVRDLPWNRMSLSTRFRFPKRIFSCCSDYAHAIAKVAYRKQIQMKVPYKTQ